MSCLINARAALAFVLVAALPLVGDNRKGAAPAEDTLIREMKFVRVPKGTFWTGGSSASEPTKQVTIDADFEIAAYTVTQGQWEKMMGNNPSRFSRQGKGSSKVEGISNADLQRFPVEQVSWDDVQEFLKKLNAQQKGKGWTYRLPKAAEWEYACRNAARSKEGMLVQLRTCRERTSCRRTRRTLRREEPRSDDRGRLVCPEQARAPRYARECTAVVRRLLLVSRRWCGFDAGDTRRVLCPSGRVRYGGASPGPHRAVDPLRYHRLSPRPSSLGTIARKPAGTTLYGPEKVPDGR